MNDIDDRRIHVITEAAKRGARLLDKHRHPDWTSDIDVARLDMANGSSCVLAQLYGDYRSGVEALSAHGMSSPTSFGFTRPLVADSKWRPEADVAAELTILTQAWKNEILARTAT